MNLWKSLVGQVSPRRIDAVNALLLESDWLYGQEIYRGLFRSIIERYIGQKITQHQLARFFLNDLIRYYRTICRFPEYKTANGGKSWGDRNLKLMFSRKLLLQWRAGCSGNGAICV